MSSGTIASPVATSVPTTDVETGVECKCMLPGYQCMDCYIEGLMTANGDSPPTHASGATSSLSPSPSPAPTPTPSWMPKVAKGTGWKTIPDTTEPTHVHNGAHILVHKWMCEVDDGILTIEVALVGGTVIRQMIKATTIRSIIGKWWGPDLHGCEQIIIESGLCPPLRYKFHMRENAIAFQKDLMRHLYHC